MLGKGALLIPEERLLHTPTLNRSNGERWVRILVEGGTQAEKDGSELSHRSRRIKRKQAVIVRFKPFQWDNLGTPGMGMNWWGGSPL